MPSASASHASFRPFYFVFAGDPHVGITRGANRRFARLTRQVNRLKPAFVLISGDMVHGHRKKYISALDSALEQFQTPVNILPGNHDVWNHETLNTYRQRYGHDIYAFTYNNCDFICLNSMTLCARNWRFKARDSRFRAEVRAQWDWLEKTLAASRAAGRNHVFIHMHIPPFTRKENERAKLTNMSPESRKRLLALARRCGVNVILAGHVHMTKEIRTDDFTIYTVGGTFRPTDLRRYGYRIFKVSKDSVTQKYVRLHRPVRRLDF